MLNDLSSISNAGLRCLLHTFGHEIIDCHGMLLLSTDQVRNWELDGAPVDAVDVEATMNKRYVAELVGDLIEADAREELMACGRSIIQIWAERIALRFPERNVIFYLGGSESVIVRFHTRRHGVDDWLDVTDRQFVLQSRLELYELRDRRVNRI